MPSHYGKMGHKDDPKKKKKPNAKNGRMALMKNKKGSKK